MYSTFPSLLQMHEEFVLEFELLSIKDFMIFNHEDSKMMYVTFCGYNLRRVRVAGTNATGNENGHRCRHQPHHFPED